MQNAIPSVPETPVVALIPEVRVYEGQNQIRRAVGLYAMNYQGQDVRTQRRILAPGASFTITEPILALVLSSASPVQVGLTYELVPATPVTATMNAKLLIWDQALTSLTITNTQTTSTDLQLTYVAIAVP